jgi:hypothetical protein
MNFRHLLVTFAGAAALTFMAACSDTRRADRPAGTDATADRLDADWMRERDEYVTRRERELNDVDQRWENFKDRASAKSRSAWNELKEETTGIRRDLSELRTSSRESWEDAKRGMDARWEEFERDVNDVFSTDDRPNPNP